MLACRLHACNMRHACASSVGFLHACGHAPFPRASVVGGRLQTYLLMHKQRHHAITEIIEPFNTKQRSHIKASGNSAFLDSFLSSGYQVKP